MPESLIALDHQIFFYFNSGWGRESLDPLFVFLSWMGAWPIGLVALLLLLKVEPRIFWRRHVPILLAGILVAAMSNYKLKRVFRRARPMKVYAAEQVDGNPHQIRFLDNAEMLGRSFPSGHSMTTFFFMSYVAFCRRRRALLALAIAIPVAFSRIYVGAHFPIDCIAGALVGTCFGFLTWLVFRKTTPMAQKALP